MDFSTASKYAVSTLNWLSPYCSRIEVAGSIRRNRPPCADIDIVCIPKVTEDTDMLGAVIGRTNHCLKFLQNYVNSYEAGRRTFPGRSATTAPKFLSGGDREGKQLILQLPKCQLDLWFACERTFASRLLMRTGSKEHNIWFAQRAQDYDLHWFPYYGLAPEKDCRTLSGERVFELGLILPASTEADLYRHLGLDLILPENRESAWLAQNLQSGLPA